MEKIKVYTMAFCPYCKQAKALLTQRQIPFEEILVADDDDQTWQMLEKKSGMKTMPQIFKGEKLIGGYHELSTLDKKDQLSSLKS